MPVPGLAALRRAGVGGGLVVAGGLHPRRLALELLPRRGQGLVHRPQDVSRLGLTGGGEEERKRRGRGGGEEEEGEDDNTGEFNINNITITCSEQRRAKA